MKTVIRVLILLALLAGNAQAQELSTAADWTLQNAAGEAVTLSERVSERPALLFFWATWCPYCKSLMPHLQSIRYEYGDHVDIISIQVFDDGDAAAYLQENGYEFDLLLAGDDVAERYGVSGTPGVILVDSGMQIRFDLNKAPRQMLDAVDESAGHRRKAALRAPFWAAQIRAAVDGTLTD